MGAKALQLVMLTAVRSDQAVSSRWREFDLREKVWRVPIERCLKIKKFLRENNYDNFPIPLSNVALELLKGQAAAQFGAAPVRPDAWVFPGTKTGCTISNGTMERALDEYGGPRMTVHGMRSTFRDWAGEKMILVEGRLRRAYSDEGCEICIGHLVGDAARQAYRRRQALVERRVIAEEWAEYLTSATRGAAAAPTAYRYERFTHKSDELIVLDEREAAVRDDAEASFLPAIDRARRAPEGIGYVRGSVVNEFQRDARVTWEPIQRVSRRFGLHIHGNASRSRG